MTVPVMLMKKKNNESKAFAMVKLSSKVFKVFMTTKSQKNEIK